jgi:hypothetical protein
MQARRGPGTAPSSTLLARSQVVPARWWGRGGSIPLRDAQNRTVTEPPGGSAEWQGCQMSKFNLMIGS